MARGRTALLACALLAGLSCHVEQREAALPALVAAVAAAPPGGAVVEDPALVEALTSYLKAKRRSGLSEFEIGPLARTIVREARRQRLDVSLVLAVIHVESRYDAHAMSPVGALGLMQILPSTGEELAAMEGVSWRGPQTLFDPHVNVRLGTRYLRQLADRYGSVRTALVAYNWGPGRIDRRLRRGSPLPKEYAQLVLDAQSGRYANRSLL